MGQDVAAFAKVLREEGIEAAKAEAGKILADARAKADEIVKEANTAHRRKMEEANREIEQMRQRAEAEMKLVARDLILQVKKRVEEIAARLLSDKVEKALSTPEIVKSCLLEVLKTTKTGTEWELSLGPTVGKSLAAAAVGDLFRQAEARGKLTDAIKAEGFALKSPADSMVIEVTAESVSEAFRQLLSPELEKLLPAHHS